MQSDPVIVDSLIALYSEAEIEGFWKQSLEALISRSTLNLHINRIDRDGQSDSAIPLNDENQIKVFVASCKEALRRMRTDEETGDEIDPYSLGRGTDRSQRRIRA